MKIGNNDIADVKIGSTDISQIRIGTTLIWERTAPMLFSIPQEEETIEEQQMSIEEEPVVQQQPSYMSRAWNFITSLFKFR